MNIKMATQYAQKLQKLRAVMAQSGVDVYLIPRADAYLGEFVPTCAERLSYISGFTGSAGTAVIGMDHAVVMSDGRYRVQLRQQLDPELFESADSMAQPFGVWLAERYPSGTVIGYDPHVYSIEQITTLRRTVGEHAITLKSLPDNLVGAIWEDRPAMPASQIFAFDSLYSGASTLEKLAAIKAKLSEQGAQSLLMTAPDSVCWLLNVRARDLTYLPVALSRLFIDFRGRAAPTLLWEVDKTRLSQDAQKALSALDIEFSSDLGAVLREREVLKIAIDAAHTPAIYQDCLPQDDIIWMSEPSIALKARKNDTESVGIRRAHIADGVAIVKMLAWLAQSAQANRTVTEMDVAAQLNDFRAQHPAYKGESFPAIVGAGAHGAIVHYRADEASNVALQQGQIVLIDSGGQYYGQDKSGQGVYGTTDITRTIVFGEDKGITDAQRTAFTLVLKGHIALACAVFEAGTTGAQLDILARKPLQDAGLDYAHGTGHGVGCFGHVHEEAASISPRGKLAVEAGMLLSNEPGYYEEGAYGIRTENLILCKACDNRLSFETVTLAPYEARLIDFTLLTQTEKDWLHAYHMQVIEALAPFLAQEDQDWLQCACQPFLQE